MSFKEFLYSECKSMGLELGEVALERFKKYYEMLNSRNGE